MWQERFDEHGNLCHNIGKDIGTPGGIHGTGHKTSEFYSARGSFGGAKENSSQRRTEQGRRRGLAKRAKANQIPEGLADKLWLVESPAASGVGKRHEEIRARATEVLSAETPANEMKKEQDPSGY